MSTQTTKPQPQPRSPHRKSPLARVLLSLVGAGGLTTIVVALILLDWGRLNAASHAQHGGFVLKDLGDKFLIIAGNVRNAVRIQAVPKEAIYAYRMPQA
jgi:hypothetical protein